MNPIHNTGSLLTPPRKIRPSYRRHSTRNFAICSVYDHTGRRVVRCLPGAFESSESLAAYATLVAEIEANRGRLAPLAAPSAQTTINELVLRFLDKYVAVEHVDVNKKMTQQGEAYNLAVRPVARIFGSSSAAEFDAAKLEVVRDAMINGSWMNEKEHERPTRGARQFVLRYANRFHRG